MAANTNGTKKYDRLVLPAPGMDLEATLFCGQSFAWRPEEEGAFVGVAGRRAVRARQRAGLLELENLGGAPMDGEDKAFWAHYFALDVDYAALHRSFAADDALAACLAAAPGIRVLRQPLWDTLLSFLLSQNCNIPRITGMAARLRGGFGPALPGGEHAWPAPETLAALTPEDLAPVRAGFRAKYLIAAGRAFGPGGLGEEALRALPTGEARAALCTIAGVGPKVADCVLLYGLHRAEVAPMDVWMKRAMARLFPGGMPACAAGAEGIAQQYIFAWARQNLSSKGEECE